MTFLVLWGFGVIAAFVFLSKSLYLALAPGLLAGAVAWLFVRRETRESVRFWVRGPLIVMLSLGLMNFAERYGNLRQGGQTSGESVQAILFSGTGIMLAAAILGLVAAYLFLPTLPQAGHFEIEPEIPPK